MREPAPNYSNRRYERPNQSWVCGLAREGEACPAGPTARGECPALAECAPTRDGDRWQCNRSALRGGPCAEGPTPDGQCTRVNRCMPMRSLRATRGRFVLATALMTLGVLMVMLSADWRDKVISPGELSRQHAQVLASEPSAGPSLHKKGNCAACHAAAEQGALGWTASLLVGHNGEAMPSRKCMTCHEKSISTEFAMMAHSVAPEKLHELRSIADPSSVGELHNTATEPLQESDPARAGGWGDVACAVCHREHQGADFDLTAMSDAACQSCHRQRYESFAIDHPDFGAWPYIRRTRITFDHASHNAKHFAEKKQAFDCRSCHFDDVTGRVQLTANYETACAACHDDRIATSVASGITMFALPTLDLDALQAAGHEIGPWPRTADGDFDGRLSPAMKLLLASDPAASRAIATLGATFEFMDVEAEDPRHLEASASLVAAMKQLLFDLSSAKPNVVRERIRVTLGREVSDTEAKRLVAGLATETIEFAVRDWFSQMGSVPSPQGMSMPETVDNVATPRAKGLPHRSAASLKLDPIGVWFRDDATLSLRYQPAAHADPVLTAWLELLASTPRLKAQPLAMAMFKELAAPTAAGLCTTCHSVEQTSEGGLVINWRALDRAQQPQGFTKFSHGPHLLLPQLADCTHCHTIDTTRSAAAVLTTWDSQEFVSDFAPLTKQACVGCHTSKVAGDRCQKCHNYHVGEIEGWRLR